MKTQRALGFLKLRSAVFALTLGLTALSCGDPGGLVQRPAFLAPSADVIDFGVQNIRTTTELTLTLINKGDTPLKIEPPLVVTYVDIFTVDMPAVVEVAAFKDVGIPITFTPTAEMAYETQIEFKNNSSNKPLFILTVKGTSIDPGPCGGLCSAREKPPKCVDFTTIRYYDPDTSWCDTSTIADGICIYPDYADTDCRDFGPDMVCGEDETGATTCIPDPCGLVSQCADPPKLADGSVNPCFNILGECIQGQCVYTSADGALCNDGSQCTINDQCGSGTCRGTPVTCDLPPDPICLDTVRLRRWDPTGWCDGTPGVTGLCHYQEYDTNCANGCNAGQCVDDPCPNGDSDCDDGNGCTNDWCEKPGRGCINEPLANAAPCVAASGECPTGSCVGGSCLSVPDVTCEANYQVDLCMNVDIAGLCTAAGKCVVTQAPPEFSCPGCIGVCLKCFANICIPF